MPAVTRVLPWRRHQLPAAVELETVLGPFRVAHPKADVQRIVRAHQLAGDAHRGQFRQSGEPYITHPLAVATIVARYGMDETTVIAALLHDAVEDTSMTVTDVVEHFDQDVADIVDGVTKLDRLSFATKEAQQAATIRKMLVAMAEDIRVLVIKLADRLHNMRTIAAMDATKQERIAHETLDVYAPLAHRLGMGDIKQQLEDLCFAALHPKRYAEIDHMVATRDPEREIFLAQVAEELRQNLAAAKVQAEVTGRPKHLWSIYEKMVIRGREFDDITDLVGLRVIVDSVRDCYAALGSLHALWTPIPGRFKDYIATPKFNLYQSLHTTLIGPQGKPVEVQIRTKEMHGRAEWGVAAHYAYKEGTGGDDIGWVSRLVDWQSELSDPQEFMANLKIDLDQDEVFVFTPKGDIITLSAGSTPLDFAYAIHTEVGHATVGARVAGRLVPLDTKLNSGDTVEIFTSKAEGAGPSADWLDIVATRSAASKIRQWFSRERREDALEEGREAFIRALRRADLPVQQVLKGEALTRVVAELAYVDADGLFTAIGNRHVNAESVAGRIARALRTHEEESTELVSTPTRMHRRRAAAGQVGVHVEGFDDVLVRIARCCTPVPGDEIMGFITRGRGVSVHRADCANAVSLSEGQQERTIDVEWDDDSIGVFVSQIEVKAIDRSRLLRDVTAMLSDSGMNILACTTVTTPDRISRLRFELELGEPAQLDMILNRLLTLDSVYDVYRVVPGKGG
jgi:GTP pyrophosphokinase